MNDFFAALFAIWLSFFGGGDSTQPTPDPVVDNEEVTQVEPVEGEEDSTIPDETEEEEAEGPIGSPKVISGYTNLVFNEEFSSAQLDRNVWCTRYIYGGGSIQVPDSDCVPVPGAGSLDFLNDERQRYVDYNRSGETMHVVGDGVLKLRATATRTNDSYAGYESAMIRSKFTFRPDSNTSYFVVTRVKLPNVVGTWPAFWLNPDADANGKTPWPPEIDILEAPLNGVNDNADMIHQQVQVKGGPQTASGSNEITYASKDFETKWKNYYSPDGSSLRNRWIEIGAEWTVNGVCYYIDGTKTACENYKWVTDNGAKAPPAHLLLNLAIGGQWAGRYGVGEEFLKEFSAAEIANKGLSTKFPTNFQIDYVHVYRNR